MDICGVWKFLKCPTCYKSVGNPSLIDTLLSDKASSFQNSIAIEVGLADFHLMILTVLKSGYVKRDARIVLCRECSKFD